MWKSDVERFTKYIVVMLNAGVHGIIHVLSKEELSEIKFSEAEIYNIKFKF